MLSCQDYSCFPQLMHVRISIMGEKKTFSTRVDEDRIKDLKHLAVDTDRSLGDLLAEAIQDLVQKHQKAPKK